MAAGMARRNWISQQVPDGTDWLEYMVVSGPETKGIPPNMSQETLGVLDHFSLGVFNMEKTVDLLYAGDRLTAKHSPPQIGLDGKWQLNIYDPDGTRAEVDGVSAGGQAMLFRLHRRQPDQVARRR
jgi:hypothetical protein